MENPTEFLTEEKIKKALAVNSEDAKSAIQDEDKFERLVQRLENKLKLVPYIGEYVSDIACMVSLVRSYIKKEYIDIPIATVISIVSALIYIVSPFDLLFDGIPVIGYLDDVALLVWVMKSIHSDVEEYKEWRIVNNKVIITEI